MAMRRRTSGSRVGRGFAVPAVLPAPATATLPTARRPDLAPRGDPQALAALRAGGHHVLRLRGADDEPVVVVGRGGVFVLVERPWRGVVVQGDRALAGGDDVTAELFPPARLGDLLTGHLADLGLAPGEVHLVVHLPADPAPDRRVGPVHLVGDLLRHITSFGVRLTSHQVELVRGAVAAAVPVLDEPPAAPGPGLAEEPVTAEPGTVWLEPEQARAAVAAVTRPLVLTGAAGTGTTTVAVHRAVHQARQQPGLVLLTAVSAALVDELRHRVQVLGPEIAHRVHTVPVAAVQRTLLAERGVTAGVDDAEVARAWEAAWRTLGARGGLETLRAGRPYWQDEVTHVVRSRGLTSLEQYLALPRTGRLHPLDPVMRGRVWQLAEAYRAELAARRTSDGADLAAVALERARDAPRRYRAVVVDQVEDLDCLTLRTLAALTSGGPGSLTLVGDSRQGLHVGGFTFDELGLRPDGMRTLTVGHRADADLTVLAEHVLGGSPERHLPQYVRSATRRLRAERLVAHVAACAQQDGPQSVLVVHLDEEGVDETVLLLAGAGLPARHLLDEGVAAVRVGTVAQAKGLEAVHVAVADVDHRWFVRDPAGLAGPELEHDRLLRRRLHVAVSRASRSVWIGAV